MADGASDAVQVVAARKSNGNVLQESIPAKEIAPGRYVLTSTPGLAQGVAAGDTIAVREDGTYEVLDRGGNLAVQVFARDFDRPAFLELMTTVEGLGGVLDGGQDTLRVFTVPVSAGFGPVEGAFQTYTDQEPGSEWYSGNVYRDDGVTPLNWWE